jgi:hypothetical protein
VHRNFRVALVFAASNNMSNQFHKEFPSGGELSTQSSTFVCESPKVVKYREPFLVTAALVLVVTGLAKVLSAMGHGRILMLPDPVFGISYRHLLLLVGLVEFCIACFVFRARRRNLALLAVAWMATGFLLYRVGLSYIGGPQPCHCLGTLTDILNIPPHRADNLMKGVLAFLLIASYGILWGVVTQGRTGSVPAALTALVKTLLSKRRG